MQIRTLVYLGALVSSTPLVMVACGSDSVQSSDESGRADAQPQPDKDAAAASAEASVKPDGAIDDAGATPALPTGKFDEPCKFAPLYTGGPTVQVDPSGQRIIYTRLVPGTTGSVRPAEMVARDLTTNRVLVLAPLGTCRTALGVGTIDEWRADSKTMWMKRTPAGVLFADDKSVLRLVSWSGTLLATLPATGIAWLADQAMVVGTNTIRASSFVLSGATSHFVTHTSDGGAGVRVESGTIDPAVAATANVRTTLSGNGDFAGAVVDFNELYTAPVTAGAAIRQRRVNRGSFSEGRTPTGAVVIYFDSSSRAQLEHVDFDSGAAQELSTFNSIVLGNTTDVDSILYPDIDVSYAELRVWRLRTGAATMSVASAPLLDTSRPRTPSARTALTPDGSNYIVAPDAASTGGYQLYSVALGAATTAFRPARHVDDWVVGGEALLVSRDGSQMRFDDLKAGTSKVVTFGSDGFLLGASRNGKVVYVQTTKGSPPTYGLVSTSDTGARRDLAIGQPASGEAQALWTDGIVQTRNDGYFFYR